MMNIDDDGYVETLSLGEAQAHLGRVITMEENIEAEFEQDKLIKDQFNE